MDRVINAVLPKVGLNTVQATMREKKEQEMLRRYRAMLDEADSEQEKEILRDIIARLQM